MRIPAPGPDAQSLQRALSVALWLGAFVESSLADASTENPALGGGFAEAAEGTRTLDLLHGKQTL